jgi:RHS repeat-associated protein
VYDAVGNILQMQHRGTDPLNAGWKRTYEYLQPGAIPGGPATEPPATSNRLTRTVLNASGAAPQPEPYLHDAHGNMLRMPHLGRSPAEPNLHWDYRDHLHRIDRTADSSAFHVYDASGQRVRKVWEKAPGLVEERIYLGGFEIFRKHGGTIGPDTATLERETLHVMDGERRVALVETRTLDADGQDRAPRRLIRYQLGNHLGSATLELDEQAQIVSYEEYAPWGTSTYQAVRSATESPKRYRHTGKERDEESGLYYHGARHYAPWLGRWIAADRSGLSDGPNMFCHVHSNPVRLVDPGGHAGEETKLTKPAVVAALQQKGLPYATEVEFELLDASGKAIKSGRFDVMTVDPRNGNIIIAELKGTALDDVTKNQKIYVPILESANGGVIRITGSKGGPLGLQAGVTTRVTHDNYVRVGTKNLADFTEALHEVTGGAPVKHSFLDRAGKMHLFETTEAFNAFLEGSGRGSMLSRAAKGVRHAGPALSIVGVLAWGASAQAAETSDKPPSDQELRSYKGNLGLRLNLGATLNDTVNAAPYGDLATYLTVGIQSDAILRMKALEFATINNFRQFGGSLEQIENAPYMFDSRSGGVYQISSNATSDSDLGTLTKVKTLGKSIFGWWTDGGNVVYRDSDKKLYLNHW